MLYRDDQGYRDAFTDMSVLFHEVLEEIRAVNTQLRKESEALRSQAKALRERQAQLLEQSVTARRHLRQSLRGTPTKIQQYVEPRNKQGEPASHASCTMPPGRGFLDDTTGIVL